MKNVTHFEKNSERGDMWYVRDGHALFVQWHDLKVVSMISSYHKATDFVMCTKHGRQHGEHVQIQLKQPKVVQDYNHGMGGVDVFDQRAAAFRIQRRARKYYKAIIFDIIEVCVLNSYTLFLEYIAGHPGEFDLPSDYSQEDFRLAVICQLVGIGPNDPVPVFKPPGKATNPLPAVTHLPETMEI